jgi:hypothetical protein
MANIPNFHADSINRFFALSQAADAAADRDRRFELDKQREDWLNADRDRNFELAQQQEERMKTAADRRFELDKQREARDAALEARNQEKYEYEKSQRHLAEKVAQMKLADLQNAQEKRDFAMREYNPLAEGLGSLRAGQSFDKLPEDQRTAVEEAAVIGQSNTVIDNDSMRRFALDRSVSGEDDRYQKYRNMQFRLPDGDMSALYGGKSGKSGSSGKTKTNTAIDDYNLSALYTSAWNKRFGGKKTDYDRKETFRMAHAIYTAAKDTDTPLSHEQALGLALGDSMFNVRGKKALSSDLKEIYGKQFTNLDPENQQKLIEHTREFSGRFGELKKARQENKLTDAEYLKELQRLDQTWRFDKFASPVQEEIYHLEYADLMAQLKAAEEYMAKTHPRRYKWVKDNPNVAIDSGKMRRNLFPTWEEQEASGTPKGHLESNAVLDYYDFEDRLRKILDIRRKLLDRERWVKETHNLYRSGKK